MKKIRPIILAGGIGKRLWPFSTEDNPKQFIPIFKDLSLFDLTIQRVNNNLFKKPIIVTADRYLDKIIASTEKTGLDAELIVLEPQGKNTYPAITLATALCINKLKDECFIVMPSDHYISKNKKFYTSCRLSMKEMGNNKLVIFGVKPDFPSDQFGYILSSGEKGSIVKIKEFIEKPDNKKTKILFTRANIFWNAGIFAFNGNWFLNEVRESNKTFLKNVVRSLALGSFEGNIFKPHAKSFEKIEKISIDKALIEKSKNVYMTPLEVGWSDLGSWASLSAFHRNPSSPVSLYKENHKEKIERPWGYFEVIMENKFSKIKLIQVMPGQKLSLQRHKYRSETWHLIQGKAKVTRGEEKFTLELGDSVNIARNQIHSLENPENIPLEIIEIQTGEYLGEDDIVRIEDIYGRADLH